MKTGGIQDDIFLRAYGRVAIEESYLATRYNQQRPTFLADYRELFRTLNGLGRLFVRYMR